MGLRICQRPLHLNVDRNQDLTCTTGFRQIYATVLDRWLAGHSAAVLGRKFAPLAFI
jgi:uncharacterized protein (DUF1501 family)